MNSGRFQKGFTPWNKGLGTKAGSKNCLDCHKKLNDFYSKYCKGCANKGDRNYNWKGGVTTPNRIQRAKFRSIMQKQVFERDNYTCQLCGAREVALQVDHIQSWKDYVDQRFNMDNCRTLCESCHYEITFGKPQPKEVKTWGRNFKQIERGLI